MLRRAPAPVPSLKMFQRYCAVLLDLKQEAQHPPEPKAIENAPVAATSTNPAESKPADTAELAKRPPGRPQVIWSHLALLLEQQLMQASRVAGPVGLEFHREAVYVMAALTDETFVHMNWEGSGYWLAHLLEARFFQTHFAGEQFFHRIDQLLARDDDPAAETASVYLAALALGFRGRYWEAQHQDKLDAYRKRLFFFIARRDPEIGESADPLFPEAYRNTIQAGAMPKLPQPRRWIYVLCGLVIAWVIAAQVLWQNLSSDLHHKVCCLNAECSQSCAARGGE
ncbi:MAG TPA: DotU family type IV/VI secretion system protein [Bryobacteraceae bacterium]|nr:DotU family type IV/VI secretion system protein [Bryobacteraceae bacterium]